MNMIKYNVITLPKLHARGQVLQYTQQRKPVQSNILFYNP